MAKSHKDDPSFLYDLGTIFPTEFPYEFDSSSPNSTLSSPLESDVASIESDEEDILAGLTRRLTHTLSVTDKPQSGSPQSTLNGLGSWSSNNSSPVGPSSQVPSPPTTPFGDQNATWNLIYAAAGEVAKLKMNSLDKAAKFNGRGLLGPPSPSLQFQQARQNTRSVPNWSAAQKQQIHRSETRNVVGYESGTRCGYGLDSSRSQIQTAWPPLQQAQFQNRQQYLCRNIRPVLPTGSNVKRESTGTGVFLPRRYSNLNPEPPRKRSGVPTVLLPAKVVQALNLSFEDMNVHQHHFQPRFNNTALAPIHEAALVARRNALLTQQRRGLRQEGPLNHEVRLPQEWIY